MLLLCRSVDIVLDNKYGGIYSGVQPKMGLPPLPHRVVARVPHLSEGEC